jgi:pimeloyl-ACP methyl ester carboxylesterase
MTPIDRIPKRSVAMLKRHVLLMVSVLAAALGSAGTAWADEVVDGQIGPGALYRIVRPTNWNGTLVLYAHGWVSTDQPVAIPSDAQRVIALLAPQGVAVALSSFSDNGWVVKDGAQRTHQLLGIFTSKFGNPSHVYVAGGSMGGLIAIKLIETYPGEFAGALLVCPAAGGTRAQGDYGANVYALFDLFYPGVLPGYADLQQGVDATSQILQPAIDAMTNDSSGALKIASIDQTPIPFANVPELFESIVTPLVGAAGLPESLELTHGQPFFDNSATQYTGALSASDLQWINANIQRFSASPAGLNLVEHNYTPTGHLTIPALMISTFRDPNAPGFHAVLYRDAVAAAGDSDWLVQRSVPGTAGGYGHCTFTPQELSTAFSDLILWGEYGVKPTP